MKCKKCDNEFEPKSGLKSYCSLQCRNSRTWSESDKKKKSQSARRSDRVKISNTNRVVKRLTKTCPVCGKEYRVRQRQKTQKTCSTRCRNIGYSTGVYSTSYPNNGGYRIGSGRGKNGWYRGYWCDSSYELAWVIYSLDHDIRFTRNTNGYEYQWNGKTHKYYPDFLLTDQHELVEIKGYLDEKSEAKRQSVTDKKLRILMKSDLKEIFEYVHSTYGTDFIRLYEGNPHNEKKNECKVCGKPCKQYYCSRQCTGRGNNRNSKIR